MRIETGLGQHEPVRLRGDTSALTLDDIFEQLRGPLDDQDITIGYSENDSSDVSLEIRRSDDDEYAAGIVLSNGKPKLTVYQGKDVPPFLSGLAQQLEVEFREA